MCNVHQSGCSNTDQSVNIISWKNNLKKRCDFPHLTEILQDEDPSFTFPSSDNPPQSPPVQSSEIPNSHRWAKSESYICRKTTVGFNYRNAVENRQKIGYFKTPRRISCRRDPVE